MYTEIISPKDTAQLMRIRKVVDPAKKYFTDEDFGKIIMSCSGMLDRVIIKCFLGIEQKAKDAKDSNEVHRARLLLGRFEAGLIEV
jgi:hypothetical protein